jgi:hypothetical protein
VKPWYNMKGKIWSIGDVELLSKIEENEKRGVVKD